MLLDLSDLQQKLTSDPALRGGCILDTNVLFAASFPLDTHNEWAEDVFKVLHALDIPLYTNINVRNEFLELNRRVLIPEGLLQMHVDLGNSIDPVIDQKLKSLRTRSEKAFAADKTFKLSDPEIKQFRNLMSDFQAPSGKNGWDLFCDDYLSPSIDGVWEDAIEALKIEFLGSRKIESQEHFDSDPRWEDATRIIGKYGIGSSDAMIVNLFMCSKFPIIVTTDRDVAHAVSRMSKSGKYVLAPPSEATQAPTSVGGSSLP